MSLLLPVIVFGVLAGCGVVVVVGYIRAHRKSPAAGGADPADPPAVTGAPAPPDRDEKLAHTDSWIWR